LQPTKVTCGTLFCLLTRIDLIAPTSALVKTQKKTAGDGQFIASVPPWTPSIAPEQSRVSYSYPLVQIKLCTLLSNSRDPDKVAG
jgi:hypothetical protein